MDARAKIWRRLSDSDPVGLEQTSTLDSPVFAPDDVDWRPFTVVTGNHGAGKTYLLRTLANSYPSQSSAVRVSDPPFDRYGQDPHERYIKNADGITGRHIMRHRTENKMTVWEVDLDQPPPRTFSGYAWPHESPQPYSKYVDVRGAFDKDYELMFVHWNFPDATEHIEGPFPYTTAERRVLRDITGRYYDELGWYSFEADSDLFVPRPEGVVDGRTVPAERMSHGELWVHYLLYTVRTTHPGNTVLIDEPETHLSPIGHTALLDELARITLARNIQTIIATHSTSIICRTPASMLRVLTSSPTGVRVVSPATTEAALQTLGHRSPLKCVVFVEDALAKQIVTTAIATFDRSLAERIDIVDAGGRDEALSGARVLSRSQTLHVGVLLDGDQRGNVQGDRNFFLDFLPGGVPDEELLRQASTDPQALAGLLGQHVDDVVMALDRVRFAHHQFWFTGAATHLAIDERILLGHLIGLWLYNEWVGNEFRRALTQIRNAWTPT